MAFLNSEPDCFCLGLFVKGVVVVVDILYYDEINFHSIARNPFKRVFSSPFVVRIAITMACLGIFICSAIIANHDFIFARLCPCQIFFIIPSFITTFHSLVNNTRPFMSFLNTGVSLNVELLSKLQSSICINKFSTNAA